MRLVLPFVMSVLMVSALCAVSPARAAAASTPAAERALIEARSALLQGDAMRALRGLKSVPAVQFAGADAGERACLIDRFDRAAPPELAPAVHDPFTREVMRAYQDHWWHVLRAPPQRDALEAALLAHLKRLLGPPATSATDFDAIGPMLRQRLRDAGYHAVPAGRTPPIQELLVWRQEVVSEERVVLPESTQTVRLHVLDEFVSRGWSHYSRCGYSSAAGWANEDGVFAVRAAYDDLAGEKFRVMLLGHEAQHFSDYARFPGLPSWALEFRAKLAELSIAQGIHAELLQKFERIQGDSPDVPHAYANRLVLQALKAKFPNAPSLSAVPPNDLSTAARAVLIEDSASRLR